MATDKDPVVRRDEAIRSGLIGTLVVLLVATIGLSERPLIIGNQPYVMAGIAATPTRPDAQAIMDRFGIHTLKLRRRPLLLLNRPPPPPPAPAGLPPLRFGYAIVETDVLALPFWFRRDDGNVLFYETPRDYVSVEANAYNLHSMGVTPAVPVERQGFAWWSHLWGWLFVAAAAGIGLFELGAVRRRREAEGMI